MRGQGRTVGRLLVLVLALADPARGAEGCGGDLAAPAVLQRLNALRAEARSCGGRQWPAAAALRWDERLAGSAQSFAGELAQYDQLSHVGHGTLRERLRAGGYRASAAGENLAAGSELLDEALAQWLNSAAHCENLMLAEFSEVGLACVSGPGRYRYYWVMHLARPAAP